MKKLLLALICSMVAISATAQIKCTVKGTVVDRPASKQMYLNKSYEDLRVSTRLIDIKDGRFEFTIQGPEELCYELVFREEHDKGYWMSVSFFTTNGTINMTLHKSDDFLKNKITGGVENEKLLAFSTYSQKLYDSLYEPISSRMNSMSLDEIYNDYGRDLEKQIDKSNGSARSELQKLWREKQKSGDVYTDKARAIRKSCDSMQKVIMDLTKKAEMESLSLYGYSVLVNQLSSFSNRDSQEESDTQEIKEKYAAYSRKYPNHGYTKMAGELLNSIAQIRVGGKYLDFTAPNLDGRMISLSSQIKGKIAIIDLWASWCGPCRENSKSYIPIYDEYKDRGFTIVGVAREKDNDKAMRKAIERDGYKWLNLTEINDRAGIWGIYGVGNGGGGVVMVDRDGTILAFDPKAEEVRKILEEKTK